jgi:hypothetical protein
MMTTFPIGSMFRDSGRRFTAVAQRMQARAAEWMHSSNCCKRGGTQQFRQDHEMNTQHHLDSSELKRSLIA